MTVDSHDLGIFFGYKQTYLNLSCLDLASLKQILFNYAN